MSRPSTLRASARVRPVKPSGAVRSMTPPPSRVQSFISLLDFTPEAIERCLGLATELKTATRGGRARGVHAARPAGTSRCSSTSRRCARA